MPAAASTVEGPNPISSHLNGLRRAVLRSAGPFAPGEGWVALTNVIVITLRKLRNEPLVRRSLEAKIFWESAGIALERPLGAAFERLFSAEFATTRDPQLKQT